MAILGDGEWVPRTVAHPPKNADDLQSPDASVKSISIFPTRACGTLSLPTRLRTVVVERPDQPGLEVLLEPAFLVRLNVELTGLARLAATGPG